LSDIDGRAGLLFYRGYDIHQPAGPATFEEIAYLPQRGHPPTRGEQAGCAAEIGAGTAHVMEQHAGNRPDGAYVGKQGLTWTPLGRR
jgi:hypothetical protein